jgi:multicomponent Na+:H+ antiporter subunit G
VTIREWIILLIMTNGVLIMLTSTLGVLRLPDVFTRMHAVGKAITLGISCLMIAAGLFYPDYIWRMLVLVVLFFVTGPIATTTMARAAYRAGGETGNFALHHDDLAEREPSV